MDLESELTAFSAIEPIGELSSSFERLVTASTSTEHLHLLRLCSQRHSPKSEMNQGHLTITLLLYLTTGCTEQRLETEVIPGEYAVGLETLDTLQCGAQLLTAFTNPAVGLLMSAHVSLSLNGTRCRSSPSALSSPQTHEWSYGM